MSKKNAYPNYDADVAVKQPKRKKKGSGLLGRIVRRFFLVLFTIIILIVAALCLVLNTIFQGPTDAAREILKGAKAGDLVITLGSGDIYLLNELLFSPL